MSKVSKSTPGLLQAVAAGVALIGAAAMPLQAAAQQSSKPSMLEQNSGITVVRDATTGQLRGATQQEAAELQVKMKAARARIAERSPMQKWHRSGATGSRLTDEFMNHVVATKNADGSLTIVETQGASPDLGTVAAPATQRPTE